MIKIVINSHPRTGISRLLEYIRISYDRTNKKEYGEYSNKKDFLLWTHIPVMLLSKFDDIKQITIIRHPDDVIPSVCDKLDSGVGLDVHDGQITYHNTNDNLFNTKEDYIAHTVNNASMEYLSYLENTIFNFNNLTVFTFEDVINNIDIVIDKISSYFNDDHIKFNKDMVYILDKQIHDKWKEEEKQFLIRANRGPKLDKPESYYKFKKEFLSNPLRDEILEKYKTLISMIKNL